MILGSIDSALAEDARIGFITSRKVGGAVDRNRVRRRFRELIRMDRFRIKPGLWLVIIGRNRACSASFGELQAEWRTLAAKAGIFLE
jgi:ribonuclease P protein component